MVHIVTGSINSGKTTKLLSLYKELKRGDGFILPKIYIDGSFRGQQIIRLSNGTGKPFSFKMGYIPPLWDEKYSYDVYSFSMEGLDFAFDTIENIIDNSINPVFMDEIGPLELQEKGFYHPLAEVLSKSLSLYISVRETHLKSVIDKFRIENYEILKV
ncbi:MAG TPA: nucleoside-triphosphatase [Clostridia bacterium]